MELFLKCLTIAFLGILKTFRRLPLSLDNGQSYIGPASLEIVWFSMAKPCMAPKEMGPKMFGAEFYPLVGLVKTSGLPTAHGMFFYPNLATQIVGQKTVYKLLIGKIMHLEH